MAYFYDKTNDIHLIYHNNSKIDFQDEFIDSSMDLLDDFFYNYNFNNIVINYNKSVYDVLIEKSFIEEQVSNYSNDNTDNYSFKNEKNKKLINVGKTKLKKFNYHNLAANDNFALAS